MTHKLEYVQHYLNGCDTKIPQRFLSGYKQRVFFIVLISSGQLGMNRSDNPIIEAMIELIAKGE